METVETILSLLENSVIENTNEETLYDWLKENGQL